MIASYVLLLLVLATCSHSSGNNTVDIKIGVVLPFDLVDGTYDKLVIIGNAMVDVALKQIRNESFSANMNVTLIKENSWFKNVYASSAQSMIATKNVIEKGAIGIVGDLFSVQTIQNALISSELHIPQCSYASGSLRLNDRTKYPYFYRTVSGTSMTSTSSVLLRFINYAKWSRIGIIYTDESLGKVFAENFARVAKAANIEIEFFAITVRDTYNPDDFLDLVNRMYQKDIRVLVMFGLSDINELVPIAYFLRGYNLDDLVILNSNLIEADTMIERVRYFLNNTDPITGKNVNFTNQQILEWVSYFWDGRFTVTEPQMERTEPFKTLWEMEAQRLNQDKNSNYNQAEAYTCLYSMIYGLNRLVEMQPGDRITNLRKLANRELNQFMTIDLFSNITTSAFTELYLDTDGNRIVPLIMQSFQRENNTIRTFQTESYSEEYGYRFNTPLYFRGYRTAIPPDRTPEESKNIAPFSAIWYAVLVIGGLFIGLILLTLVILHLQRGSKAIRNTFPVVTYSRLIGKCLILVSCIISLQMPTAQSCLTEIVTQTVGFSLFICSSFVKSFYLYRLTSRNASQSLKTRNMILYIVVLSSLVAGINIAGSIASPMKPVITKLNRHSMITTCQYSSVGRITQEVVFFVYVALILQTIFYSYKLLAFPEILQDKNIFPIMITIVCWGIFFIPLWIYEPITFVQYFHPFKLIFKMLIASIAFIALHLHLVKSLVGNFAILGRSTYNASADFSVYDRDQSFWAMRAVIDKTNSTGFCMHACYREEFTGPFSFVRKIFYGKWYRCILFKPSGEKIIVIMNQDTGEALIFNIRHLKLGGRESKDEGVGMSTGTLKMPTVRASQRLAHRISAIATGSDTLGFEYKGQVYKLQFANPMHRQQLEDNIINWNEMAAVSSNSILA
jgi:hypothetical protein